MRIKIEQWLFVPVPACHWSRMNNSATVVEVRIREKRKLFWSRTIRAIFERRAVSTSPAALTLSSPSLLAYSRSSHRFIRYHKKIEQIFLCLLRPWEGLHTKQIEDGIGIGWSQPCSLCSFASTVYGCGLCIFVVFLVHLPILKLVCL